MRILGAMAIGFCMSYVVNESVTPGHLLMIGGAGLAVIAYEWIGPKRLKAAARWYWAAVTTPPEPEDLWW